MSTGDNDGRPSPGSSACCGLGQACVFAKALLAHSAGCALSTRSAVAERTLVECRSPVAHTNCSTLAALLHERARFALKLPSAGRPLIHMQALRLQCGGLTALRQVLCAPDADVHGLVGLAHERLGSLTELPWDTLVPALVAWQPQRRRVVQTPPAPDGP